MKQKNGFIMCDYAFPPALKSEKGMATRDDRVRYAHRPPMSTVGKTRVIERAERPILEC